MGFTEFNDSSMDSKLNKSSVPLCVNSLSVRSVVK